MTIFIITLELDIHFVVVAQAMALVAGRSTLVLALLRLILTGAMALPCRLNQLCSGEGEFERELEIEVGR